MNTLCGAKTRSGHPCKRPGMPNGRCSKHGGKSLIGQASPSFKHGRRSKYLPARLQETYEAALSDPDFLETKDEIALCDARINDLMSRIHTGESGALWRELRSTFFDFKAAVRKKDALEMNALMIQMDRLISDGNTDYANWNEINGQVERRRKLVATETKRLFNAHQAITVDKLMILIAAIVDIIRTEIGDDRAKLSRIATGIRGLLQSRS